MSYQICTRCVMDTSDPEIHFDVNGVCNHCHRFDEIAEKHWFPDARGARMLAEQVEKIKVAGVGRDYDSIMGLSGGVDSSYLAVKMVEMGLRPLVVHVDGGWNSELATNNIEQLVKRLNLDLYTHVVNWREMQDLQAAYLRSGVANQDVPQDHAFFAELLRMGRKHRIKYVISGSNYATEGILPSAWGYNAMDSTNLRAIHKTYGKIPLKDYPTVSFFDWHVTYPRILGVKFFRPLNYMPYDKQAAKEQLMAEYGWKDYGGKHYESRFTKFFQGHYLIERYGYDKRRAHLASVIVSGQMTRDEALAELEKPAYPANQLPEDIEFIRKKLGLSQAEFDAIMQAERHYATDFKSDFGKLQMLQRVRRLLKGGK